MITLADQSWSHPGCSAPGPVSIAIRPEKLRFADHGLGAQVTARTFQGGQWLLELDTAQGPVLMQCQNSGPPPPQRGTTVALTWQAEDMHLLREPEAR